MSLPKKGQRNQFMFPMIEADGLSVASTLTASQLRSGGTRKGWGYNHNTTTLPASIALSATASLIKSGLFNIQLNAAESIYDRVNFIFTHATCLDQDFPIDFADYDDSDIMSRLDKIDSAVSNIASYLVDLSVIVSDTQSAARQGNSRALVCQSLISDVQSYLVGVSAQISNFQSQFVSRVTGVVANTSALKSAVSSALQSTLSDIQSGIQAIATTSDLRSRLSDIQSYLAGMSGMLSDVQSGVAVGNSRLLLNRSVISDVQSYLVALSAQISDVYSAVQAIGSTSDLRSRLSDIQSAAAAGYSRLLLVASNVSDIQSYLIAQSSLDSDTQSAARQGNSRALVCQSLISDVMSMLATGELSAVPGAAPTIGTEMQFLFQKVRNQETSTSAAATIAKSDGTVIGTAPLGDAASVFTKGKYV